MKCPVCNAEMEKGHIQYYRILAWVRKKHKLSLAPREGELNMVNWNPFSYGSLDAYICKSCKKIIMDYSDTDIESR